MAIPVHRCRDFARSLAFYTGVLGFELKWRSDEPGPVYAAVKWRDHELHLSEHAGDGAFGAATFLTVDDVADALGSEGEGYFIYDDSGDGAGTIYWDASGGSADDAVAFARLATGTSLLSTDFYVV